MLLTQTNGLGSDLPTSPDEAGLDWLTDTYWTVKLSTGDVVYQDDIHNRPSTWIRLGEFLSRNPHISIVEFSIAFRTNIYTLPPNAGGYYFSKGLLQGFGSDSSINYYVVGWLIHPDTVELRWIRIPELIPMNQFTKPLVECSPPTFILNPSLTNSQSEL